MSRAPQLTLCWYCEERVPPRAEEGTLYCPNCWAEITTEPRDDLTRWVPTQLAREYFYAEQLQLFLDGGPPPDLEIGHRLRPS